MVLTVVHGSHMVNVSGGNGGGGRDLHWRVNDVVVVGDDMVALSLVSIEFSLIIIIIVLLKVYGGISAHGSQGCQGFWHRGRGVRSWQPPPLPLSTLTPNPQGLPQPLEFPIHQFLHNQPIRLGTVRDTDVFVSLALSQRLVEVVVVINSVLCLALQVRAERHGIRGGLHAWDWGGGL